MKPNKIGQVVKFHTPLPDEDTHQLYVVLEIKKGGNSERADIKALNTGLKFPPINTVLLDDLIVVEITTDDLNGKIVTIKKKDNSQLKGVVINVKESKIDLNLHKINNGVMTNIYLTVIDKNGVEHEGILIVN